MSIEYSPGALTWWPAWPAYIPKVPSPVVYHPSIFLPESSALGNEAIGRHNRGARAHPACPWPHAPGLHHMARAGQPGREAEPRLVLVAPTLRAHWTPSTGPALPEVIGRHCHLGKTSWLGCRCRRRRLTETDSGLFIELGNIGFMELNFLMTKIICVAK